jgi:hypothetical protein
MTTAPVLNVPQLVVSLEMVERWREETEADLNRQIREIDDETDQINAKIAELQRQITAISALREETQSRLGGLDDEQISRTRDTVLSGLETEGPLLDERAALWRAAVSDQEAAMDRLLQDPSVASLVEEYKQFAELEPTLDMLPAGYRKALLAHHEEVKAQLKPFIEAAQASPPTLDVADQGFTLIASLDPQEGTPEALAVIVPVPFETYSRWSERSEDLHALIAYRVVGALASLLSEVGASEAPLQYAPYEDKLAIQVWLGDSEVQGDIKTALERQVSRLKASSTELQVCRLDPYLVWLSPDAIIPEEGDEDDGDELDLEES